MSQVEKHFVTFLSPGTFVAEETTRPVESWDVETAKAMARDVKERYDATPYGFYFSTRARDDDELDSRMTKRSGVYYLGGKVMTIAQLKGRGDPHDLILIRNMENNGWRRIIENTNSWKWTQPLNKDDTVLEFTP